MYQHVVNSLPPLGKTLCRRVFLQICDNMQAEIKTFMEICCMTTIIHIYSTIYSFIPKYNAMLMQ